MLDDFKVTYKVDVQWGEIDAMMHVNNMHFFRWAESGRIEYFYKIGLLFEDFKKIGPILAWQDCKYIYPVNFPDQITINIKTEELREDRLFMTCHFWSKKHQRLVAISKHSIVSYDYRKNKKTKLPVDWVSKIKEVDNPEL